MTDNNKCAVQIDCRILCISFQSPPKRSMGLTIVQGTSGSPDEWHQRGKGSPRIKRLTVRTTLSCAGFRDCQYYKWLGKGPTHSNTSDSWCLGSALANRGQRGKTHPGMKSIKPGFPKFSMKYSQMASQIRAMCARASVLYRDENIIQAWEFKLNSRTTRKAPYRYLLGPSVYRRKPTNVPNPLMTLYLTERALDIQKTAPSRCLKA